MREYIVATKINHVIVVKVLRTRSKRRARELRELAEEALRKSIPP